MKFIYEAPCVEVINLAAMESIALLDGHPYEQGTRSSDNDEDGIFSATGGAGSGKPNFGF